MSKFLLTGVYCSDEHYRQPDMAVVELTEPLLEEIQGLSAHLLALQKEYEDVFKLEKFSGAVHFIHVPVEGFDLLDQLDFEQPLILDELPEWLGEAKLEELKMDVESISLAIQDDSFYWAGYIKDTLVTLETTAATYPTVFEQPPNQIVEHQVQVAP